MIGRRPTRQRRLGLLTMDVVGAESPVPQLLMASGTDLTVEGAVEGNPTAEELDIKVVPSRLELLGPPEPV